jgi:hypothetical protein
MATERFIGQHVSTGPAPENGQRQAREFAAHVGQKSGGENQQNVPARKRLRYIEHQRVGRTFATWRRRPALIHKETLSGQRRTSLPFLYSFSPSLWPVLVE